MSELEHADELAAATERSLEGGPERHREKAAAQGKLPVRERVARLLDPGSFSEEGLLAGWEQEGQRPLRRSSGYSSARYPYTCRWCTSSTRQEPA